MMRLVRRRGARHRCNKKRITCRFYRPMMRRNWKMV